MRIKTTFALALLAGIAVMLLDRLVWHDQGFNNHWLFFFSWLVLLLVFLVILFWPELLSFFEKSLKKKIKFRIDPWFAVVLVAVLFSRFFLINVYPFTSIGDELRDGGLDAIGIATGTIGNIFSYGRYESHGLIIPTFASFFYPIIGNTSLLFRVPAALIGSLDILLFYQLVKQVFTKRIAVIAALILAGMPLHLYYSRTELVVIFSSLMTTVSLWFFYIWIKNGFRLRHLAALGLILGFTMNFHGSVRAVAYILALLALAVELFHLSRKIILKHPGCQKYLLGIVSLLIMIFVGIGPRLVFSSPKILFQTGTIPLLNTIQNPSPATDNTTIISVISKSLEGLAFYPKSILVYFYEPTQFHYADHQSILPFLAGLFLIAGIITAFMINKKTLLPFLVLFFLLPLTNSALTNCINCDHRLAPALPVLSMFTALGLVFSLEMASGFIRSQKVQKIIITCGIVLFIIALPLARTVTFFQNEPANDSMFRTQRKYLYQDFMATYLAKDLINNGYQGNICIRGNKDNENYFNLMHIKEMFQFYVPDVKIEVATDNTLLPEMIYVSGSCEPLEKHMEWQRSQPCENYQKYYCPVDHSKFSIYYAAGLF